MVTRLRESSDRSLGLMYVPYMCLGEVHALEDMRIVRTLPMDFLLSRFSSAPFAFANPLVCLRKSTGLPL